MSNPPARWGIARWGRSRWGRTSFGQVRKYKLKPPIPTEIIALLRDYLEFKVK